MLITPLFTFSFFHTRTSFFSVASLTCFDSSDHVVTRHVLVFSLALEKSSFVSLHVGSRVKKTD